MSLLDPPDAASTILYSIITLYLFTFFSFSYMTNILMKICDTVGNPFYEGKKVKQEKFKVSVSDI